MVLYRRESLAFVRRLLLRTIFRSHLHSRMRGKEIIFRAVYFRDSDPYLVVAVPIEGLTGEMIGVLQAETSLKDILDVVSSVKLGKAGYAYVVTRSGDLIAHANYQFGVATTQSTASRSGESGFSVRTRRSSGQRRLRPVTSRDKKSSAPTLSSRFWIGLSSLNVR